MSTRLFLLFATRETGKSSKREKKRTPPQKTSRAETRRIHQHQADPRFPPRPPCPSAGATSGNAATSRGIFREPPHPRSPKGPPGRGGARGLGRRWLAARQSRAAAPASAPGTAPPCAARRGGGAAARARPNRTGAAPPGTALRGEPGGPRSGAGTGGCAPGRDRGAALRGGKGMCERPRGPAVAEGKEAVMERVWGVWGCGEPGAGWRCETRRACPGTTTRREGAVCEG